VAQHTENEPPYILVVLAGDQASQNAAAIANELVSRRAHVIRRSPHELLGDEDYRGRAVVLFGHGLANGLGPASDSLATLSPEDIGRFFSGSRVFAFACSTLAQRKVQSIGARAIEACVDTFVGFDGPIKALTIDGWPNAQRLAYHTAALAMIEAFLDGEDDRNHLAKRGLDAADRATAPGLENMGNVVDVMVALDQLHLRIAVMRKSRL